MVMEKEKFMRVHNLMLLLIGKESHRIEAHTITELFNAHNMVFPEKLEYSKGCSGCRERVYKRLRDWYESNKATYGV